MAISVGNQTIGQNTATPVDTSGSIFNIRQGGFFSRNGYGEYLQTLKDELDKRLKSINISAEKEGAKFSSMLVDNTSNQLNYSCIVVVEERSDVNYGTAHVLIVERTGQYPTSYYENLNGQRTEVIRTPGDAADPVLDAVILSELQRNYKKEVRVVFSTLVPNEFDVNSIQSVDDLLFNTISATNTEMVVSSGKFSDLNISHEIQASQGKFTTEIIFNAQNLTQIGFDGLPVRQDAVITLYREMFADNRYSVNNAMTKEEYVKVYGYIDFVWLGQRNGPGTTQRFVPNFIITNVESKFPITPAVIMLAVVTSMGMNDETNWLQGFRPTNISKGEIDFRDIGALNLEGNIEANPSGIGKKTDLKNASKNPKELAVFSNMLVYPTFYVGIDVPVAAPSTWYTDVFRAAAMDVKGADLRIRNGLNSLTNGNFAGMNSQVGPLFEPVRTKVFSGYWTDHKNVRRDLREFDYLAVANLVAHSGLDMSVLFEFANSFNDTGMPIEMSLQTRKKIIDNLSNGSAVIKQYADRVWFSNNAIQAAIVSLQNTGFVTSVKAPLSATDFFQQRAVASYFNTAPMTNTRFGSSGWGGAGSQFFANTGPRYAYR